MKKILASILALTLALSMGTVALAASYTHDIVIKPNDIKVYKDKAMESATGNYVPGTTFYIPIENLDKEYNSGKTAIRNTSGLKDYRLNYKVNDGKKYFSSAKFATKSDGSTTQAWIAITTVGVYTSDSTDLDIDFTVYGKNDAQVDGGDTSEFNITLSLENGTTMASSYTTVNSDSPIVNFDDIDDTDTTELYFDNDVEFHVNAKGQRELYLKYSDDPSDTKYDLDSKFSNATLEYHLWEGTNKTFRRTGQLYLPASSLNNGKAPYLYQISSSGTLTQVKAKYDSNEEEFIIDTATLNNYVISDIALSGSSSGSTNDTNSTPTETPSTGSGSGSSTTSSSATEIANQVAQKIKTAKSNGTATPSIDITVQNEESISAKDMQTIVSAAKNAGGVVRFVADTVSNGNTQGRLYIKPSSSAVVKYDVKYGVYTDSANVGGTKDMFEKYYNNTVAVVRLSQNPTFGFQVSVAAKVDLSGLNTKTLKFYSYDRSANKYYVVSNPSYWVDTAGFLHFNTTLAGDILITDKALAAK